VASSPSPSNARRQGHRPRLRWLAVAVVLVATAGLGFAGLEVVRLGLSRQTTTQPATPVPLTAPPAALNTAADYLALGDYDFDQGDDNRAIADYSRAIDLNPDYAAAFNNRAYTYMTMQDYAMALPDLDRAIDLRPNYVNALLNRGDIYNFYYQVDRARAIADYDRALAADPSAANTTSVCGHRAIAANNGMTVGLYLRMVLSLSAGNRGCPPSPASWSDTTAQAVGDGELRPTPANDASLYE